MLELLRLLLILGRIEFVVLHVLGMVRLGEPLGKMVEPVGHGLAQTPDIVLGRVEVISQWEAPFSAAVVRLRIVPSTTAAAAAIFVVVVIVVPVDVGVFPNIETENRMTINSMYVVLA